MSLKARINEDMKNAMRAKEALRLSTLRLLLAAIKQREVDERIELDDAQVVAVIEKMLKQRKDSVTQYQAAGRQDLVDQESGEMVVLQGYMPEQMGEDEIRAVVAAAVAQSGAAGVKDMGKVMGLVKPQVAGKADMGQVSALIKQALGG